MTFTRLPVSGDPGWLEWATDIHSAVATGRVYHPMNFGAVGDGASHPLSQRYSSLAAAQADYPFATDLSQEIDGSAIQAASNAARSAGGGTVTIDRRYTFNQRISFLGNVNVRGGGGGEGSDFELRATGGAAQVRWGDGSTGQVRGGLSGGFVVNGDGVGGTSQGGLWFENRVTQRAFVDVTVEDSAGDGCVRWYGQNNYYAHFDTHRSAGHNRVWDYGTGGHLTVRSESSKCGGYHDFFGASTGGPYARPTHLTFIHCLSERGHDSIGTTKGFIRSDDSDRVLYINHIFAAGSQGTVANNDAMFQVIGGDLVFDNCTVNGINSQTAIRQEGGRITLQGRHMWRGVPTVWVRNGGAANLLGVEQNYGTVGARWAGSVGSRGAVQVQTQTLP